jgi:hypothetical protein
MTEASFTINVPAAVLADMTARLSASRFAPRVGRAPWDGGADPAYLRELVKYWADEFTWQRQEDKLNSYDHSIVDVEGTPIHVVRVRARDRTGETPIPILLLRFPRKTGHGVN